MPLPQAVPASFCRAMPSPGCLLPPLTVVTISCSCREHQCPSSSAPPAESSAVVCPTQAPSRLSSLGSLQRPLNLWKKKQLPHRHPPLCEPPLPLGGTPALSPGTQGSGLTDSPCGSPTAPGCPSACNPQPLQDGLPASSSSPSSSPPPFFFSKTTSKPRVPSRKEP